MAPRRKCPTCGSKKWHKEPSSGLVACSEGHLLQDYRSEVNDAETLGNFTMKKRTLKSNREKKGRPSKADPKLYHGNRARYHYFQCLQLLLRKQVAALVRLWALPDAFEAVCRDLWALHISLLEQPVPPEPYFHLQEFAEPSKQKAPAQESDSEPDEGAELEELMRQNSDVSSEEEGGNTSDGPADAPQDSSGGNRKTSRRASETPISTIVILVLTCWTLRIPALYRDFIRAIEAYDLPYLDSTRYLPKNMVVHLNPGNTQALSPPHAPKALTIHTLAARLARRLKVNHETTIPAVNAAPVLWRTVKAMHGPPLLYHLVASVANRLHLPLTLHSSLAPELERESESAPHHPKYDSIPPELAFMAVVVMVLKVMYGLDGKPRVARSRDHPQSMFPSTEEYLQLLCKDDSDQTELFSSERALSILDLDPTTLDDYMDLCEKALVKGSREAGEGNELLQRFFPVEASRTVQSERWHGQEIDEMALPRSLYNASSEELEPGQGYKVYAGRDICGDVSTELETVLLRGSEWVKVDFEDLVGVLEVFERRLKNS